ncbi:MAG: endospore germination permease [Bacilli bacterium]|nr:endospore germination permease [Bacilli bacterium]
MITKNKKINAFQFAILGLMLGNALIIGFGGTIIISLAKQDAWLIPLIAPTFALIPIVLLIYIINYEPDKNIFAKIQSLFGKYIGSLINIILTGFIAFVLIFSLWSAVFFSVAQYLSKVPYLFLATCFILTAIYGVTKGIETIARTNEIFFFINIILIGIIVIFLYPYIKLEHIQPILPRGIMPIIGHSVISLSYIFPPILTLSIIPKNNIIDQKKYHWYLILGVLISIVFLFILFFYVISIVTINLAELFRYPGYHLLYKIDIAGIFTGLENFLSLHWLFSTFSALLMCSYFVCKYTHQTFKIKQRKYIIITNIIIGLLAVIVSDFLFPNSIAGIEFMQYIFPYYIFPIPLIIFIIMAILIFLKKRKNPETNIN